MITNEHISISRGADARHLVTLINRSYRSERSGKGWTSEKHLFTGPRINEETLLQLLDNKSAVILKYTNEKGDAIGCVYLEKQGSQMYLGLLSVHPESQTSGI